MTAAMTPNGLLVACCGRWLRCGSFWRNTGLSQPTAERALRFGVLWRKRSLGTASDQSNRWVERILSLKETCRLQARATYAVLVETVTCFFHGPPPERSWINARVSTASHPR